jgi:hypothetical protein
MMKRVVIVGNGLVEGEPGSSIDAADFVIRFNEPPHPPEKIGVKTDILFLMNSGKSMQARLSNPTFLQSPILREAREIILPYHPSVIAKYHGRPNPLSWLKGRRSDWTSKSIEVLGAMGKPVTVLPVAFYEESCADLGIPRAKMRKLFPSTGFLGIRYALENFPPPEWQVEIIGFGWTGWKRHDWEREREWVASQIGQSALSGQRSPHVPINSRLRIDR